MLIADEVTVRFSSSVALDAASLSVDAGEFVAVVGRSGSGKSTLLHCLAGIVTPTSGSIRFGGQRIDGWSERRRSDWRLRHVGLVFQFGDLVPELSLAQNAELPLLLAGAERREVRRRAAEMLERLEIADLARRRPAEVSGGESQRAAIARALVHRPAVVLADEPTGALDSTTGQLVLEALLAAAREQNSAVVLVTHEARLSSCCDREITLRDGAVVQAVSP